MGSGAASLDCRSPASDPDIAATVLPLPAPGPVPSARFVHRTALLHARILAWPGIGAT